MEQTACCNPQVTSIESAEAGPAGSLLDRVELPGSTTTVLASGRRVESAARSDGDLITLRASSGEIVLSVLLTDRGAVLQIQAVDVELSARGRVAVTCEDFEVSARRDAVVAAGRYADIKGEMVLLNSARPRVAPARSDSTIHEEAQ